MTIDLRQHSTDVIRRGQTPTGAYLASPTFQVYRYAWLRDGAFIAYGMDRAGQHDSARAFHRWVDRTLRNVAYKVDRLEAKAERGEEIGPSEWLHCRYTPEGLEGEEGWGNFQLDGYGAWLWSLCEHVRMTGSAELLDEVRDSVALVTRYLTRFWDRPNFDCWEEHGEYVHPATLACMFGGLQAVNSHHRSGAAVEVCGLIKKYLLKHFVHDGHLTKFADGRSIDANLLWVAVPFGLLHPQDPLMVATVAEVDRRLVTGGLHRYPEDTYYGGGEWVLLTAWLGWYYERVGIRSRARAMLDWVERQVDPGGDLPEQVTDRANQPDMVRPWVERWGPVAKPLLWSHAMYLVLVAELGG
ncbi:MAG TPA: glycoside hydrolase family 15 protein [Symbiobacteriaceae bacterium]